MEDVALSLCVLRGCERIDGSIPFACEAFGGLLAGRKVGALYHGFYVGSLFGYVLRQQNEAARSCVCNECIAFKRAKGCLPAGAKIRERRLDHPIRNLFDTDLKQKIRHQATASACCAAHASATPTASLRT